MITILQTNIRLQPTAARRRQARVYTASWHQSGGAALERPGGRQGLLTTSILMNYAIEDILAGRAVVWIASDGSARKLLEYIPGEWVNEVIFVSPGSTEDRRRPIAWNPLKTRRLMSGFKWLRQ